MTSEAETTEASRQIVKRFYSSLCAADFEGVLACFHPDIEIHEPECLPYGGVYRGMDEVMRLFSVATKLLDSRAFEVDAIIADGNVVVGMIRTAVIGTGTPLAVAEESTIRDGKIIKVRVFQWDPTLVIRAAQAEKTKA